MTQLFANVLKEFSTISNVLENGKIKFIIVNSKIQWKKLIVFENYFVDVLVIYAMNNHTYHDHLCCKSFSN